MTTKRDLSVAQFATKCAKLGFRAPGSILRGLYSAGLSLASETYSMASWGIGHSLANWGLTPMQGDVT